MTTAIYQEVSVVWQYIKMKKILLLIPVNCSGVYIELNNNSLNTALKLSPPVQRPFFNLFNRLFCPRVWTGGSCFLMVISQKVSDTGFFLLVH